MHVVNSQWELTYFSEGSSIFFCLGIVRDIFPPIISSVSLLKFWLFYISHKSFMVFYTHSFTGNFESSWVYIYLSFCLSVCISVCLFFSLSVALSVSLSVCMSVDYWHKCLNDDPNNRLNTDASLSCLVIEQEEN